MILIDAAMHRACVAFVHKEFGGIPGLLAAFAWILNINCCTNPKCVKVARYRLELTRARNALQEVENGHISIAKAIYNEADYMKPMAETLTIMANASIAQQLPGTERYAHGLKRLAAVLQASDKHHLKRLIGEQGHN